MEDYRLVPVGKIVRTHGVRGAVKVYAYGNSLAAQERGGCVYLRKLSGSGQSALTIVSVAPQGRLLLVVFGELKSLEEAETLIGEELFLPEDKLPLREEGEYYYYQIIGLSVELKDGSGVGTVRSIIETGSNDVYVVESGGKEVLIPAVEDVICEIDLERGRIIIDPPEGLLD
jgi:16S rRNA processing protein RimM